MKEYKNMLVILGHKKLGDELEQRCLLAFKEFLDNHETYNTDISLAGSKDEIEFMQGMLKGSTSLKPPIKSISNYTYQNASEIGDYILQTNESYNLIKIFTSDYHEKRAYNMFKKTLDYITKEINPKIIKPHIHMRTIKTDNKASLLEPFFQISSSYYLKKELKKLKEKYNTDNKKK